MSLSREADSHRVAVLQDFDPNTNGLQHHGLFGLPFSPLHSNIVIIPVPWELTVSYGAGTMKGPDAVLEASQQLDLYSYYADRPYRVGMAMVEPDHTLADNHPRDLAEGYIRALENGHAHLFQFEEALAEVNAASKYMVESTYQLATKWLEQGHFVGLLGGDHSTPLGYWKALADKHPSFGILQIDAHADLRIAYEDFIYSHASIVYNALNIPQISSFTQVGLRDFSMQEYELGKKHSKLNWFTDHDLKRGLMKGRSWEDICIEIVATLPDKVAITFDIDGLEPSLCPNTGTPVPGGLTLEQVGFLLETVLQAGKTIIGFDLVEVSPAEDNDWDANVGARALYMLSAFAARSQKYFGV